jgi:hypothetical protein
MISQEVLTNQEAALGTRVWRTEHVGLVVGSRGNGTKENLIEVVVEVHKLLTGLLANVPTAGATGWSRPTPSAE